MQNLRELVVLNGIKAKESRDNNYRDLVVKSILEFNEMVDPGDRISGGELERPKSDE